MIIRMTSLALALALAAPIGWAHGNEKHGSTQVAAGRETAGATLSISPEAADAVAVLERFSAALSAGDLDGVAADLDPAVLILESGGAERTRDEYLGGHAKHDAEFLKTAHITLKRRTAQASGDLVWVGSESEIHASKDAKMLMISSTETAILRKTGAGWKIVHLHWSSRAQR
jgi:ketosteroid isomerase-like protein